MATTLTYTCDKCGDFETVTKMWNNLPQQPTKGWLIISVDVRSIKAGQLYRSGHSGPNRKDAGCLCKECAEKLGWVGPEAQPVMFEDLIREIVQEEMEP